jgi:ribonucleoside-triphosphate reductase
MADLLISMSYYMKHILTTKSDAHFHFATDADCWEYFKQTLISFIYTMNQPLRSQQSPFTNVSIYDRAFLENLVEDIIFPDGTTPDVDLIMHLQEIYIDTMNEEMERTPITFPVTTLCLSTKDGEIQDENYLRKCSPKAIKYGFLNVYMGDSSTLSSCCRLRSSTKNEFFNSFGAGSSKIGSLGVVTINFPRLAYLSKDESDFENNLRKFVKITALINQAKRNIVQRGIDAERHPLYNLGFMELSKQYSTTGVNGLYECLDILGHNILTDEGQDYAVKLMQILNSEIDACQEKYHSPHNVEQIPGENTSIKFCKKDKYLGYDLGLEMYSNQFVPLTSDVSMLDRIIIQDKMDHWFSGGSVLHLNVSEALENPDDFTDLVKFCAKSGVVYFAINYLLNKCENGHMTIGIKPVCPKCGAPIVGKYTRVVGFLTEVSNWHKVRREKDFPNRRFYDNVDPMNPTATVSPEELEEKEDV